MRQLGVVGACLLTIVYPVSAFAQVDPITEATALRAKGAAAAAYKLLRPLASARPDDAALAYAFGLAAADSGRPGEAIAAFERVLALEPSNTRVRADIARVYAMAGDIDTARAQFDVVVSDPTVPDPVRQQLSRLVHRYDRRIAGHENALAGFVDAEIGHDTNVNSATGLTSITLPVFAFLGPATLSGTATRMSDNYYQLQAGLTGTKMLSRQTTLYASILTSRRDNFDTAQFDQTAVAGTLGLSHATASGNSVAVSAQGQRFWLGADGFRTSLGAIAQFTHPLAGGRTLSVQAQYFHLNYDGDQQRDAARYASTMSYADRGIVLSIGGGRERTIRSTAQNLGYWFAAFQGGIERPLNQVITALAGLSIEHRDHDSDDPLFLATRRDTQIDATLGLRIALGRGFSIRPRATLTRNYSNIPLYDYRRATGAVGLRLEF